MKTAEELKSIVVEKYGQLAEQASSGGDSGCCGAGCGCGDTAVMAESYTSLEGYVADADLGLGCGLPTTFASIQSGDTVVDLGSGAGNDAFVARSQVGDKGLVIGVDMTQKMIDRARINAAKLSLNNVEFRLGDIEQLPLSDSVADVVISNCVLNLVPDKEKAFAEIFRILKPGGRFSVSDIVLLGELPEDYIQTAENYAGCVSGAVDKSRYLEIIRQAGFVNIDVRHEKRIPIDTTLAMEKDANDGCCAPGTAGIYSISVSGQKSADELPKKKEPCCGPGCCDD